VEDGICDCLIAFAIALTKDTICGEKIRGAGSGGAMEKRAESFKPVEITGGRKNLRSLCFGGGFMSDMNVRSPKEAERSLALLGMTMRGKAGKGRDWGGFVLFSFPSPDGLG